jgi:hypothetical protein
LYASAKKQLSLDKYTGPSFFASIGAYYLRNWDEAGELLAKAESSAQSRYDPNFHLQLARLRADIEQQKKSSTQNMYKLLFNAILIIIVLSIPFFYFTVRKRKSSAKEDAIDIEQLEKSEAELTADNSEYVIIETLSSLRGDSLLSAMDLIAYLNKNGIKSHLTEATLFYTQTFNIHVPISEAEKSRQVIDEYNMHDNPI